MKKFLVLTLALVFCVSSNIFADNDKPISVKELPVQAREFIAKYFPNEKVALAKVDRDLGDRTYEVIFVSSIKIEFLGNGQWKEVDCQYSKVPEAIVPVQIKKQLDELYTNSYVVKIEKDKRSCEVKLNSGLELQYDRNFRLTEIDD